MNLDQTLSLARTLLKVAGGILVTKGVTDSSSAETISSAIIILISILWSHFTHSDPKV